MFIYFILAMTVRINNISTEYTVKYKIRINITQMMTVTYIIR